MATAEVGRPNNGSDPGRTGPGSSGAQITTSSNSSAHRSSWFTTGSSADSTSGFVVVVLGVTDHGKAHNYLGRCPMVGLTGPGHSGSAGSVGMRGPLAPRSPELIRSDSLTRRTVEGTWMSSTAMNRTHCIGVARRLSS